MEKLENYELEYDIEKSTFIIETENFLTNNYQSYHRFDDVDYQIKRLGNYESPFSPIYDGNKCYFYNVRLAFFLTSDFLHSATKMGFGNRLHKIRGRDYYKYYEKAFFKGKKYFEVEWRIPASKVHKRKYSAQIGLIMNLCDFKESRHKKFHAKYGWYNEAHCNVELIDVTHIANAGFYAGVYTGYMEMNKNTGAFIKSDISSDDPNWFVKEIEYLGKQKNEFCEEVDIKTTIDILMPLAEREKATKHVFLEERDFTIFIRRAFLMQKEYQKVTLNEKPASIGTVMDIFFKLYDKYKEKGCEKRKTEFVDLIENNITNYTRRQIVDNLREKRKS